MYKFALFSHYFGVYEEDDTKDQSVRWWVIPKDADPEEAFTGEIASGYSSTVEYAESMAMQAIDHIVNNKI